MSISTFKVFFLSEPMIQNYFLVRHLRIQSLVLLGCLFLSPVAGQDTESDFSKDLDQLAHRAMQDNWVPGAVVVVVQGDKTLYLGGFGMADVEQQRKVTKDTAFYVASSTKSFTGLAAAICAQRGELDLQETLDKSLADVKFHDAVDPSTIRLQDLLTHTHGISNDGPLTFRAAYSGQHTPEILKGLVQFHDVDDNGKEFRYGNIGYNIAGLAMQNRLDIHWKDLLKREIFEPLAMESTTGRVSEIAKERLAMPYQLRPDRGFERAHYGKADENMHAAGGLVTTGSDLVNWLKLNVNQGLLDGKQVVPVEVFKLAHQPIAAQDAMSMSFKRTGYGLGWNTGEYDGEKFTHHFGGFSGFHCQISFMPEHKIGVAILTNSDSGLLFADVISRFAYDHLRGVPDLEERYSEAVIQSLTGRLEQHCEQIAADLARRAARPQKLPRPLEAYCGTFESERLGRAKFELVDGKLEASMGPLWSTVEVYDAEKNALRVELGGFGQVVVAHFDDQDVAQRLEYSGETLERVNE